MILICMSVSHMSAHDCSCLILWFTNFSDMFFFFPQLEQKVHDIDSFYSSMNKKQTNTPKGNSATKDKDKDKHVPSIKKQQQDASCREVAASKRMQDLMRQFSTILRQATTCDLIMFALICSSF